MKRLATSVIILLFCVIGNLHANTQSTAKIVLSGKSANGIELTLAAQNPRFVDFLQNGRPVRSVESDGGFTTTMPGFPELPVYGTTIAIPPTGNLEVSYDYESLITIPLPNPRLYEPVEGEIEMSLTDSRLYPLVPVSASEPAIIRDFRVISVSVSPYQYDQSSQELRFYQNLQISITFTGGSGTNELPPYTSYSGAFERLYEAQIANFNDYRNLTMAPLQPRVLLIYGNTTDQTFQTKLNEFATWKRQKGFEVNVVSTSQTGGSSNTAIKTYIQGQYNNPETRPDYIILLGDVTGSYAIPTWYETLSSYNGEGDYPYTHLAGGDLLGDVFIGRIPAENISQLTNLLGKIYTYEKNVNISGTSAAWLNRMLLVGDPSDSGISCVYNNKYIKEMSQEVNPDYTYLETYNGGYSTAINAGVNQGVGFFNYRGFYGMSGWSPSSTLANGPRLPHSVILTCGTGSFSGNATSEEFVRLGTEAQPKGALTAIGMATTGTHTMFNNALSCGVFDGIFIYKMRTMGEALLNGRLYLWNLYGSSHPSQANYFAHWCNLMGDPTVEAFVGIPQELVITAPATIPRGTSLVDVYITNAVQEPQERISVTLYTASGGIVARGYTNEQGIVSLALPTSVISDLTVTASSHDSKPAQATIGLDQSGSLIYFAKTVIDDGSYGSSGNGDNFINAGETIALNIEVKNTTSDVINGISGILSANDPYITIEQAASPYPSIGTEETATNTTPFLISIATNVPAYHDALLTLQMADGSGGSYQTMFHLGCFNANLQVNGYNVNAGGNSVLDPAETGLLEITLTNTSISAVNDVYGELTSLNDLIVINDSLSFFGNIPASMTVNSIDGFSVFARPLLVPGMLMPLQLRLFNSNGFEQITTFQVPIGTVTQNTPLGPDEYGYLIYDVTDLAFPDCPSYNWIEISPSLGGNGSLISGLNDQGVSGDEGDQVGSDVLETIDLPFTFRFYGVDYNQITVCVNGFLALGITGDGEFRNGRMPGGQGPSPMIAPFWDDLVILTGGGIYRYYNPTEHTLIIQYQGLKNGYNRTSEETFQVILYDPLFYPTSMGDGMIKFQYKVFNNVDIGGGGSTPKHGNFCTIGIRDHTNTRGLEYTYNNQYPTAAAPLSNNKALLITTVPVLHENAHLVIGELIINDTNGNNLIEPGETAELGIKINNLGLNDAHGVVVSASTFSPYLSIQTAQSSYPDIPGSGSAINDYPITVTADPNCSNNLSIQLEVTLVTDVNSWSYPVNIVVKKPMIEIESVYLNDLSGDGNGIPDPGEEIVLVVNMKNSGIVDCENLVANIGSPSQYITILQAQSSLQRVPAGMSSQAVFVVQLSPDLMSGNNISFNLTYFADQVAAQNSQFTMGIGTSGMLVDFENSDGSFTPQPSNTGWQWGTDNSAGAHSGTKVWGTLLNQQYPNNVTWTLTSPSVFIGSNFTLEFWHKYDTELNYDGGNVKISTNGTTWTTITPTNGYSQTNVAALNGPGFAGSSGGWVQASFDLSNYANQTVRFRWNFASDTMITGQGWYIDDVQTTGFIPFAGKIEGIVLASTQDTDYSQVLVQNTSQLASQPAPGGAYTLYLPAGTHSVSASAPGYLPESIFPVTINPTSQVFNHDFYLGYFSPVTNLEFDIQQDTLHLTWQEPEAPLYPVAGYKVFKKYNSGRYELQCIVSEPGYTEYISENGSYRYQVLTLYQLGESLACPPVTFEFPYVQNADLNSSPQPSRLFQNYPNPFNPSTTLSFYLQKAGTVRLTIYNLRGQVVKNLLTRKLEAGTHAMLWDGKDNNFRTVASGVYLYRLETPDKTITRRMLMLK